jgi:multiple sugar transport system permease protein/fructooligosaccharide transport system permease protein
MKREQKRKVQKISTYVLQISAAAIFVLPLVWMIVSSLKPEADIFKDMSSIATFSLKNPTINNYVEMFSRSLVIRGMLNSIGYISLILLIGIPVNALCGYALARLKFPGKNIILSLIIALYIVPFETVLLPLYIVSNTLKITNTFFALFLPFVANCFNIFLFRQFFMSLPKELEEAASIDGCGALGIFIRVVLPNTKPAIATATVLTVVSQWSDFMWPLIAVTSAEHKTVQVAIQGFFTDPPVRYGPIMAALVFTTIPIIIVFLFLQKYYVEGIMSSGVKG